jgi:hypothetical protein
MMPTKTMSAVLLSFLIAGSSCVRPSAPPPEEFRAAPPAGTSAEFTTEIPDAAWDDGLAEVAVYDAHWSLYGKDRVFEARLITAKEPFAMDRHVKADPPYGDRPIREVLKENLIMEIPTENYPYRFLRTVFISRENPAALVKATVGSQEWCGNTFHEYRSWTTPPSREFHSYFDGEGDGAEAIDFRPGDLFRDQLFSTLRFAAGDRPEIRARLWPSWVTNRAKAPPTDGGSVARVHGGTERPSAPTDAAIRFAGPEIVRAAGRDWSCRRIEIEAGDLVETYWFSRDPTRVLVRYESSDGRRFLLKNVHRRDYWTRR